MNKKFKIQNHDCCLTCLRCIERSMILGVKGTWNCIMNLEKTGRGFIGMRVTPKSLLRIMRTMSLLKMMIGISPHTGLPPLLILSSFPFLPRPMAACVLENDIFLVLSLAWSWGLNWSSCSVLFKQLFFEDSEESILVLAILLWFWIFWFKILWGVGEMLSNFGVFCYMAFQE